MRSAVGLVGARPAAVRQAIAIGSLAYGWCPGPTNDPGDFSGGGRSIATTAGTVTANQACGTMRGTRLADNNSVLRGASSPSAIVDNWTIAAYVNAVTATGMVFMINGRNDVTGGYGIYLVSGGAIQGIAPGVNTLAFSGSPTYSAGTPVFVVMDRSSGTWHCFVNDVAKGTGSGVTPSAPAAGVTAMAGVSSGSPSYTCAFAALWTKVLSSTERTQMYAAVLAP